MRIVVLSSLSDATGNNTTSRRIQRLLEDHCGHRVSLMDLSSFPQYRRISDFDCALGVHAYRAGRWLVDGQVGGIVISLLQRWLVSETPASFHLFSSLAARISTKTATTRPRWPSCDVQSSRPSLSSPSTSRTPSVTFKSLVSAKSTEWRARSA